MQCYEAPSPTLRYCGLIEMSPPQRSRDTGRDHLAGELIGCQAPLSISVNAEKAAIGSFAQERAVMIDAWPANPAQATTDRADAEQGRGGLSPYCGSSE